MKKLSLTVLSLWCALVSAAFAPLFTPPINLVSNGAAPSGIQRPQISQFQNFPTTFPYEYSYIGSGVQNVTGSMSLYYNPIPVDGVISKLYIVLDTSSSPGDFTFTLRKNGVDTSLTCTVVSSTSCVDNTNSVSVSAGDTVVWRATRSVTTPTYGTTVSISTVFTSTNSNETMIGGGGNASTTARYYNFDLSAVNSTTYSASSSIIPSNGTIDKLYVNIGNGNGGGSTITTTLYKNGAATSLSCTATDSGGSVTCNNTSNSVSVAVGDTVAVHTVSSDRSVVSNYSMRWVPTVQGEIPIFAVANSVNNSTTTYSSVMTGSQNLAVDYPGGPSVGVTLKKLHVKLATAPGASKGFIMTGRKNGSNQTLTCTITGAATTTCDDTSNSFSANAYDNVSWSVGISGSSPTSSQLAISSVVTVP